MRQSLASILSNEAALFNTELIAPPHEELIRQTDTLRDHIGKTMAAIRTMNDAVEYEFGVDRQRHMETSETILRAALTAVALIWNELAVLHEQEDEDFLVNSDLVELRRKLKQHLDALVASVLQEVRLEDSGISIKSGPPDVKAELLNHPRYGEYTQNTIARIRELQSIVAGLETKV
jgi:multidrug resistance protein MdtO